MDTVLGLSVTATNVQTVLVEGRSGDGATLGHDEFDVFAGVSGTRASEQVAEAVLSIASADGHRLHSVGVTWSDDADLEASLLLDSLADLGLANVVAVQSPRAVEALARSIGRVIGYQCTAVCVIEPDAVIVSLVDTFDGEVDTLVSHEIDNDEQLLAFLAAIFEREDWRPEGLFVVGSVGGLDSLAVWLEQKLAMPVFDPPEAELALAHGAALASAADPLTSDARAAHDRRWPTVPMAMLIGGAAAFVVSVSLAVSPHLIPRPDVAVTSTHEEAAVTTPSPKVLPPLTAKKFPPAAPAPTPEAPPLPEPVEQAPPPAAPVDEAPPVYEPPPTIEAVEQPVYQPAPIQEIHPIAPPPPVVAPQVPQVPMQPRLRDKIFDKIPGLNRFGH